jgi:hypothetical protein
MGAHAHRRRRTPLLPLISPLPAGGGGLVPVPPPGALLPPMPGEEPPRDYVLVPLK